MTACFTCKSTCAELHETPMCVNPGCPLMGQLQVEAPLSGEMLVIEAQAATPHGHGLLARILEFDLTEMLSDWTACAMEEGEDSKDALDSLCAMAVLMGTLQRGVLKFLRDRGDWVRHTSVEMMAAGASEEAIERELRRIQTSMN